MKSLDKLERARRLTLDAIFICSILLFLSFLVRIIYYWGHVHQSFPHEKAFLFGDLALVIAILAITSWRWLASKACVKNNPSLRNKPRDERERFAWLKAYRPAFFVLLIVQVLGKFVMFIWGAPFEIPIPSQLSLSAALMTLIGAFLYYSRETGHE